MSDAPQMVQFSSPEKVLEIRATALTLAAQVNPKNVLETAGTFLHWLLNGMPAPAAGTEAPKPPKANAAKAPAASPPAAAPAPATAPAVQATPTPPPVVATASPSSIPPPTTIQEVAGEFRKLVLKDRNGAIALLKNTFKVEQLAQVPPQQLPELMQLTKAALARLEAPAQALPAVDPLAGIA